MRLFPALVQTVDWEQETSPAESPNMYMRVLIKETLTLHKVLSKYLTPQAVEVSRNIRFALDFDGIYPCGSLLRSTSLPECIHDLLIGSPLALVHIPVVLLSNLHAPVLTNVKPRLDWGLATVYYVPSIRCY